MDFVETRYGVDPLVGGLRPIDAFSSASNLARQARRNGNAVIEERAAKQLEAIAIDAKADPSVRRSAVKALTPYLTEQRLEELLAAINS